MLPVLSAFWYLMLTAVIGDPPSASGSQLTQMMSLPARTVGAAGAGGAVAAEVAA